MVLSAAQYLAGRFAFVPVHSPEKSSSGTESVGIACDNAPTRSRSEDSVMSGSTDGATTGNMFTAERRSAISR